jgi:predicted MPP superfamily phosphohydrolase
MALRIIGGLVFLSIAISVLGGTHYYLARRLVIDTGLPGWLETAGLVALGLLAASLVLVPIAERLLPLRLMRVLVWPGSLWMGFMFLLFVGLAATDGLLWAMGTPAEAGVAGGPPAAGAARVRALVVLAVVLGAGGLAVATALRGPVLKRVRVGIPRWPAALDGFRIVQISDLHIGPILGADFARTLVERCNALEPDLLALTGDLVDGPVRHLRAEVRPFGELRARHGVYFVTGNHDHYSGASDWVDVVRELGLRPLRNERVTIERDGAVFDLAGVDDHNGDFQGGSREDLDRALDGRDSTRALVLLAHDPRTFRRARTQGVDLQLSGHTHGGQIWPFGYLVRLYTRWLAGLYREGDAQLYVSRGTGFWGPPMRLGPPAEITEITVTCA